MRWRIQNSFAAVFVDWIVISHQKPQRNHTITPTHVWRTASHSKTCPVHSAELWCIFVLARDGNYRPVDKKKYYRKNIIIIITTNTIRSCVCDVCMKVFFLSFSESNSCTLCMWWSNTTLVVHSCSHSNSAWCLCILCSSILFTYNNNNMWIDSCRQNKTVLCLRAPQRSSVKQHVNKRRTHGPAVCDDEQFGLKNPSGRWAAPLGWWRYEENCIFQPKLLENLMLQLPYWLNKLISTATMLFTLRSLISC